jgi:hypothetical protein
MQLSGIYAVASGTCIVIAVVLARISRLQRQAWFPACRLGILRTLNLVPFLSPSTHWSSTFLHRHLLLHWISYGVILGGNGLMLGIGLHGQPQDAAKDRAGQAALVNIALVLAFSTRRNLLAKLLGTSHVQLVAVHSCLGYVVVAEVLVHALLHSDCKSCRLI